MKDTVLEVQNVTQKPNLEIVKNKVKALIVERTEEVLPNGNVKITFVLDPSKGESNE